LLLFRVFFVSCLLSKNFKIKIYKTIIYTYFVWSVKLCLLLREEHRLRVFENRLLRRIFTEEVMGGWRRLHEKLHKLFILPNIIRVIKSRRVRWAGHVAPMTDMRKAYNILVGKPEWKRPLGRPRHGCEDNIRMDLRQVWWEGVD
jgi:hypothetical protein